VKEALEERWSRREVAELRGGAERAYRAFVSATTRRD
jgi:hypothetical protein